MKGDSSKVKFELFQQHGGDDITYNTPDCVNGEIKPCRVSCFQAVTMEETVTHAKQSGKPHTTHWLGELCHVTQAQLYQQHGVDDVTCKSSIWRGCNPETGGRGNRHQKREVRDEWKRRVEPHKPAKAGGGLGDRGKEKKL